jgi:hypothetical protein
MPEGRRFREMEETDIMVHAFPRGMEIPAMFVRSRESGIQAGLPVFRGRDPKRPPEWRPLGEALRDSLSREERGTFVAVDGDSLAMKEFSPDMMKSLRVRGADIWLLTHVEDADDVFDVFNLGVDTLLAPFHTIRSVRDLRDIHDVSDSVVPVVFCMNGSALSASHPMPVMEALDELVDAGFYRNCVFDTDGRVSGYDWDSVRRSQPSAIPFTESEVSGFQNVIRPHRPRRPIPRPSSTLRQ